jgi:short-subunit dehydrogenase
MTDTSFRYMLPGMALASPRPDGAALVTGASSGIGAHVAGELAARGFTVVLVARRKQRLDELAEQLRTQHHIRVETISCDLAKATARGRLPGRLAELGLEVDVLVNNAGFATSGRFDKSEADREVEQVRVLIEAPVALCSAFVPGMVERRSGAVLNVASTAGMQPLPYMATYAAAKAHVLSFSEALHQELRGKGVTVTALCPGPVETEFWEIAGDAGMEKAMPSLVWVPAEDVARAAVRGLENGRRVVVPGRAIRAAMQWSHYVPNAIKLPGVGFASQRR